MYRLASWVHSYQACLQPLESHRKQIRLSRKQPVADESFCGWWRPSSPSWRSEPAGNTPVHGCALEPGCPLLNMFTAPAVLTPVFWMRWKTGKRERSEHKWKRKSCSVPFLMLQQTRGRLFSHCTFTPKGHRGNCYCLPIAWWCSCRIWHLASGMLQAAPVMFGVEVFFAKEFSLQGAELSCSKSLIHCPYFGKCSTGKTYQRGWRRFLILSGLLKTCLDLPGLLLFTHLSVSLSLPHSHKSLIWGSAQGCGEVNRLFQNMAWLLTAPALSSACSLIPLRVSQFCCRIRTKCIIWHSKCSTGNRWK